jgi:hypothetical protein
VNGQSSYRAIDGLSTVRLAGHALACGGNERVWELREGELRSFLRLHTMPLSTTVTARYIKLVGTPPPWTGPSVIALTRTVRLLPIAAGASEEITIPLQLCRSSL